MKKVITTVGTSIFENLNINIRDIKNQKFSEWNEYNDKIEEIKNEVNEKNLNSAEISSIKKLINKGNNIKVILLASDTLGSVLAAEIIEEYLKQYKIDVIFEKEYNKGVIKDLRIDDNFEMGIDNLILRIIEIHKKNNNEYDFSDSIFNITGGFKAIISYLSLIAQVTSSKIVYMFENSDKLMEIPIYPVSFDDRIADLYLPYLNNRILNSLKEKSEVLDELEGLKFIKKSGNKYELTEFGRFFKIFMNYKSTYFGDLIEYLLFSYFVHKKNFNKIEQGKKYSINGQNGDFDIYIENNNEIEIKEIKSVGQINKFINKQVNKYKEWLNQHSGNKKKKITLLLYLVEKTLLDLFKDRLEDLQNDLLKDGIEFNIEYLEIPLENLNFFIKEFRKITINTYNLKG